MGAILVVNAGSTSLKLHAVDDGGRSVVLESFAEAPQDIEAVAHRIVHGGDRFRDPVVIDAVVREQLRELVSLAPLHNRPALEGLERAERALPCATHVAVFDTSFHRTLPQAASTYAVPVDWRESGVRRYGFHGLSVEWCAERAPQLLNRPLARLVVCHLGGGSSITAVLDGRSVDTTMGFSPLEGVPMTTRSGSIDPAAVLHIAGGGLDAETLDHSLNFESGLKALAGGSGEMTDVERRVAAGEPGATLALEVFVHRVVAAIAGMTAATGGLDALVFTAGIGEGSPLVRRLLCARLSFLGVELDSDRNEKAVPDCDVAAGGSAVSILVVRAREEVVAARAARALLGSDR